ncbi:aminotransferase class V-fold PLP-dependent enzyme [Calditrichota bacterium]
MLDPQAVRADFPIIQRDYHGMSLVYFDSAATTQKPRQVIDAMADFYSNYNSNVHRSPYRLGETATEMFESGRHKVADFLGASRPEEIIFTRGTTEAINHLARIFREQLLQEGDVILLTKAEHHSNIVPWQMIAQVTGAKLEFVNLHEPGVFDLNEIKKNWNPRTKVFSFQHASNVLGTIHPVKELTAIARENGAISIIDGAQSLPHLKPDVVDIGCDFYTASAHKMVGPSGIGCFYGRYELLEKFDPVFGGGDMILRVTLDKTEYNTPPSKFEAGTPSICDVIGWGAAIDYLNDLGMENVHRYVEQLGDYAMEAVSSVKGITVYGPKGHRTGAVSFWMDAAHPHDVSSILDMDGICVRAGHHCAEPLMNWLDKPATTRASVYIYNTREEVDHLVKSLEKVNMVFGG